MGIIDAARRLKEKITGKLTRQKAQEGRQDAKTSVSSPEPGKGQEGAENEATGAYASERWNEKKKAIIGVDMAAGRDQTGCVNFGERTGEALKKVMAVNKGTEADEWQFEKLKTPNNERRRKGIPMVRRKQFIKAAKNARRRRKNRK